MYSNNLIFDNWIMQDMLMETITSVISKELLKKGISLLSLGINEYAWDKDNIKDIFEELSKRKIGILGGDVYKIENETIKMTFDSWYMNKDSSEEFYQKSKLRALSYIEDMKKIIVVSLYIPLLFK